MLNSIVNFLNPFNYNYGSAQRIVEYATSSLNLDLYFRDSDGRVEPLANLQDQVVRDWSRAGEGKTRIAGYETLDAFSQNLVNNAWQQGAVDVAIALPSQRTVSDSYIITNQINANLAANDNFNFLIANPLEDYSVRFNLNSSKMDINNTYVMVGEDKEVIPGNYFTTKRTFLIPSDKEGVFNEGSINLKVALEAGENFTIDNRNNFNEEDYNLLFNNPATNKAYENIKFHYTTASNIKYYLHETIPSALYTIENLEFLKKTYNEIASYLNAEDWKVEKDIDSTYLGGIHAALSGLDSYATGNALPIINSALYNSKTSYEGDFIIDALTTVASMAMNFYTGGAMSLLSVLALEGVKYGLTQYGYEKDSGIIQGLEFASSTAKFFNASNIAAKVIEGTKVVSAIAHNACSIQYGAELFTNKANDAYDYATKGASDVYDYVSDFINNDVTNLVNGAFNYLGRFVAPKIECLDYDL